MLSRWWLFLLEVSALLTDEDGELTSIQGMNFYAVLGFFTAMPTSLYDTYPLQGGYRGIGYPLAIFVGTCGVNALISYTKGHIRQMFVISAVFMSE